MIKKLRLKFVCINMTIITIMLTLILCMVVQFTKRGMEQADIQMLQEISANPLYLARPADNSEVRLPYLSISLDGQGELSGIHGSYPDLSDDRLFEELIRVSSSTPENTGVLEEYNLRYLRAQTPSGQFLIFIDITTELSTMESLTRNCILIGIFSFLLFLGISIRLANWAVRPVEQAWTQQKQFIADASHELKTPLTVILTNAELLQSPEYNSDRKEQFVLSIQTMGKQMQKLVESLLELSRIDNGSIKTVMRNFNISELTETCLCLFEVSFFENGLTLESKIENGIRVTGSESHLKQVIEILLDNTLKYASPQSQVQVKLEKQRASCLLSVSTQGDAISEDDLKNIFHRFYRIDKSRSSGSYGLGLSIAQRILEEHHGKIWAESRDGRNVFFVRLPVQ